MLRKIAVDIDGVLADQVSLILAKLNQKYGLSLTKTDITEWDTRIADTDIKTEIENALLDPDYVLSLPVIEGSENGMRYLFENYYVTISTSRPKETEDATIKWLSSHFEYHDFCNTSGRGKDCIVSDFLIDDYIPNIEMFVKANRTGLLFSQPWNKDRTSIQNLIARSIVYSCNNWSEVIEVLELISSKTP